MSTTRYIPSEAGWSSQKAGFGTSRAGSGRLRVMVVRDYDPVTNQSALTFSVQVWSEYDGLFHAYDGGSFTPHSSAVTIDHHYYVNLANEGSTPFADPRSLYYEGGGTSTWTRTITHNSDGSATVSAAVSFTLGYTAGGKTYTMLWNNSGFFSVSENRNSTISSLPSTLRTTETGSLAVTRYNSSYWHKATVKKGNATLWTSGAFETSLSFTPPRSWFDGYPNDASLALTVEVKTYTNSACTTQVGNAATQSMTLYPDAGMAPELAAGFAAVSAYNIGAVAGLSGYIQGYSKAQITIDPTKITLKNNATVASYSVACQGDVKSGSGTSFTTEILTGTAAIPITVTVTDSRGLTASETLTIQPLPYAPPTITTVQLFRCDGQGTADDDGQYISVSAVGYCSPLPDGQNPQNTLTLSAQWKQGSGSYGASVQIPNGGIAILGAGILDPDQKLTVLITATDTLGNEATATRILPTRTWAMKFRADGQGVAFGKPPEYGAKKLELPGDWELMFGAESWLNRVYPVGSIYMSVNSTDPGTLFGGTWARIMGKFLLAATDGGSTGSNIQKTASVAAGGEGGEAAHMQTQNEMARLRMPYGNTASGTYGSIDGSVVYTVANPRGFANMNRDATQETTNNMPPFLAVYVWQRTA